MIDTAQHQNFYGRFKGRPLGLLKTNLMNDLLDKVKIKCDADKRYHPQDFFDNNSRRYDNFVLEIGFGGGEYMAGMAHQKPDTGFIGCEVFVNGVASLLGHIASQHLNNIRIHNAIIQSLLPHLIDECLNEIYIMFPDPWPKFRHKRRQLINTDFLHQLAVRLNKNGFIHMASDDESYVESMLQAISDTRSIKLVDHKNKSVKQRVLTKYEQKALDQNRVCHYLTITRS